MCLFDILKKETLSMKKRETVKQASRSLLISIQERIGKLDRFWEKEQTQAEVETFILDNVYTSLPAPPFTDDEQQAAATMVYQHVWQQSAAGNWRASV